jgi:hypothetical protein
MPRERETGLEPTLDTIWSGKRLLPSPPRAVQEADLSIRFAATTDEDDNPQRPANGGNDGSAFELTVRPTPNSAIYCRLFLKP